MTSTTTKPNSLQTAAEMAVDLFDNWFDPIETEVRAGTREFIEEMIRDEFDTVLARPRYGRTPNRLDGGRFSCGQGGLKNGTLKSYPGLPHGMPTTHADQINADLLAFIRS